ncbi:MULTISPECIES: ROK family protein [unclassified Corynebacterium]|uniref:ROK family protein n=1 Tax=unclassified Corynebacterium TaxID=2624378 RepID=UPI002169A5E4|nr:MULTISPECIES: ROK family protein [unclassified Corynebacterium]MCS4492181.1 ROK family protein [Corynebacterium sp. ES2715-CONJ3]MCS4532337.1 ROK family protein [Corynebacterium sp. ES2730-CONJ]
MSSYPASAEFIGPQTPAALCLQLIRLTQPVTRTFLVDHSPHSQPTITRATLALMQLDLVRERPDKIKPQGPGRPKIPLEIAPSPWLHIGIAIGTSSTYIGLFGSGGQLIREQFLSFDHHRHSPKSFIEALIPTLRTMLSDYDIPLANIGISTPGAVNSRRRISADNLGWDHINLLSPLEEAFDTQVRAVNVIEAIAGAEQQAQRISHSRVNHREDHRGLICYADDSIGAAVHTFNSVQRLAVDPALPLHETVLQLTEQINPHTIVLAGSAFESREEAHGLARSIRGSKHAQVEIRVIPTHLDNARAAARAIALAPLLADPLGFTQAIKTRRDYYSI